jgi:hypothetical protein
LCNHILQNVFEKTNLRRKATFTILNKSSILSHYSNDLLSFSLLYYRRDTSQIPTLHCKSKTLTAQGFRKESPYFKPHVHLMQWGGNKASNKLQIRTNYTVGVLFKYERFRFVARYTSYIDNWNPAVALYIQIICCICRCGFVDYVKVKLWQWFGVTEEINSPNSKYFSWLNPPPTHSHHMELYTIDLYQQVPCLANIDFFFPTCKN